MKTKNQATEIIEKLSADQMRQILLERIPKDPDLEVLILDRYVKKKNLEIYKRLFNLALAKLGDEGDYNYADCCHFMEELDPVVRMARVSLRKEESELGLELYFMLIEQVACLSRDEGDHDGNLFGAVQEWFRDLTKYAGTSKTKKKYLSRIIEWASKSITVGWVQADDGWKKDARDLIVAASRDKTGFHKALDFALIEVESTDPNSYRRYDVEQAALEVISLYEKLRDIKSRSDFIYRHLEIEEVRIIAIKENLAEGNYENAKTLAKEGMSNDERRTSGGKNEKLSRLLIEVYEKERDFGSAEKLELEMFFETFSMDYWYKAIKNRHKSDWVIFREDLIKQAIRKQISPWRLAEIFKKEKMVQRLAELCEQKIELYRDYFRTVGAIYPKRVAAWWKKQIEKTCEQAGSRRLYREISSWFVLYQKYSSEADAKALKDEILQIYSNRPAMKQEFGKGIRRN